MTTIYISASDDVCDLIDRAAATQKMTRAEFILNASCTAAQEILLDQVIFQVSEAEMKAFDTVVVAPVSNNAAISKLLASPTPWVQPDCK